MSEMVSLGLKLWAKKTNATGGILGKITGLTDQYAVIEVQEKVRMKVMRSHIAGKQASGSSDSKK